MVYLGSKNRIAKHIVPIIQKVIDDTKATIYIEPFVGGANIIDKIKCEERYGYDNKANLIALLRAAQFDFDSIPEDLTKEIWDLYKNDYRQAKGDPTKMKEDLAISGAVSFLGSYNTKGFAGGFAAPTESRNYYEERYKALKLQREQLGFDKIIFDCKDYKDIQATNAVIYCDPPYLGVTGYGYAFESHFDHDEYWNWVREISQHNYVLCSENTIPDDFAVLWERPLKYQTHKTKRPTKLEKLVTHKEGLLRKVGK